MVKEINRLITDDEVSILREMAGKELKTIRYDSSFSNLSEIIEFNLENGQVCLYSRLDAIEYFGGPEDIATLALRRGPYEFSAPALTKETIASRIKEISVINYHFFSHYKEDDGYDYQSGATVAIIITLEDKRELSFERFGDFMEMIQVVKGESLIEKIQSLEAYIDEEGLSSYEISKERVEIIKLR